MRGRIALAAAVAWPLAAAPTPTPVGPLAVTLLGFAVSALVAAVLGVVSSVLRPPGWRVAGAAAVLAASGSLSLSLSLSVMGVSVQVAVLALLGAVAGAWCVYVGTRGRGAIVALAVVALLAQPGEPVRGAVGDAAWWALDSGPAASSPRLVLTEPSPVVALRVSGPDAVSAVAELDHRGGLRKSVVVVALPTGSGWVDPAQVAELEKWAEGDLATVTTRYSRAPSAAVLLLRPERADDAARELLAAVLDRVERMPPPDRPSVLVYGQSLGARAGMRAVGSVGRGRVAAVLWQGVPGGGTGAGRVGSAGSERCVVDSRNDDDPVVVLRPRLLWDPRARGRDTVPWLPVVSFLRTAAALPGSLATPTGSGHRYQPVLPPAGCLPAPGRVGRSSGKSVSGHRLGWSP